MKGKGFFVKTMFGKTKFDL